MGLKNYSMSEPCRNNPSGARGQGKIKFGTDSNEVVTRNKEVTKNGGASTQKDEGAEIEKGGERQNKK